MLPRTRQFAQYGFSVYLFVLCGKEGKMEEIPCGRIYARIDLDCIRSNMLELKKNLPEQLELCAVVKANGYGHGAVETAEAVSDLCTLYAAATVEEGRELRRAGVKKPILVLGSVLPAEYEAALEASLSLCIFEEARAAELVRTAKRLELTARAHLAVDTGMGRLGLLPDEAGAALAMRLIQMPGLEIEGVFTHFAKADEADKTAAMTQLARFDAFRDMLRKKGCPASVKWHCANSAAILEGIGLSGYDFARAGICMYGLYPSDETRQSAVLRPAMSLCAYLTYIKEVPAGTELSYGGIFRTGQRMRIGTVSCGYADGYPRALSGKGTEVLVHGKRCPVLGRICMDQLMIGLDEVPDAKEGDVVTLLGRDSAEEISAEELARLCGGFHYELLCGISQRVPRVYIKENRIAAVKGV